MSEQSGPIVGWEVPEPDAERGGKRPLGELIGGVFRTYRGRARPVLLLSLLIEGFVSLVTLPYFAVVLTQIADYLGRLWDAVLHLEQDSEAFLQPALPPIATDPLFAAIGGVVSILPFGSALLLIGAISALLTAPADQPMTAGGALRAVLRRWAPILLPVVLIGLGYALIAAATARMSATFDFYGGSTVPRGQWLALSVILALSTPILFGAAVYLAVRWVVAVPAIVIESLGLRAGLARSAAMTKGRRIHVFLALLVAVVISTIVGWLLTAISLILAIAFALAGAGPLLVIPAAIYIGSRILVAPITAILVALLYRDFREAEADPRA